MFPPTIAFPAQRSPRQTKGKETGAALRKKNDACALFAKVNTARNKPMSRPTPPIPHKAVARIGRTGSVFFGELGMDFIVSSTG